jgi:hypothetical protein
MAREKQRVGTRADIETIEGIPLKKFREYNPEELAVHDAFILLRKRVHSVTGDEPLGLQPAR